MAVQGRQLVSFQVDFCGALSGTGYQTDYGVPGSPRWVEWEVEDWSDLTVDIAGVTVKLKELPESLRLALLEQASEEVDATKWEPEE